MPDERKLDLSLMSEDKRKALFSALELLKPESAVLKPKPTLPAFSAPTEDKAKAVLKAVPLTSARMKELGLPAMGISPGRGKLAPPIRDVLKTNFRRMVQQRLLQGTPQPVLPSTTPPPGTQQTPLTGTARASVYTEFQPRWAKLCLSARPPGAPTLLEEVAAPVKLVLAQHQSPGDFLMLTALLRDLHIAYPGKFVTYLHTLNCQELFDNAPWQFPALKSDRDALWIGMEYPLVHSSNQHLLHFLQAFHADFERKTGLRVPCTAPKADLHLSPAELAGKDPLGLNRPYLLIDAGGKSDFTCKHWAVKRYQEVVEALPKFLFVQIGAKDDAGKLKHIHPTLTGDNVIDMVWKTNLRELMLLTYHSMGVITPVSLPMHLAAAIPPHPKYGRPSRPCVVIAGGRESPRWEMYPTHTFLHTVGQLPCCASGGCWASRVVPVGDRDEKDFKGLCQRPVISSGRQIIPDCLHRITVEQVVQAIKQHFYDYIELENGKVGPYDFNPDPEITARYHEIWDKKEVNYRSAFLPPKQGVLPKDPPM